MRRIVELTHFAMRLHLNGCGKSGTRSKTFLVIGICLLACAGGCQLGPRALKIGHAGYANAARKIQDEQMLLNLVRLRYRETPVWLEVTSISTQFVFDSWGEVRGTLDENVGQGGASNPNSLNLSGRIGYSERPTITYTILGGEDFLKRLLTPLSVSGISLLAESGWRGDHVFRLTVERMNGLRNAPRASGPTPRKAPQFESFLEAVSLMQDLLQRSAIEFAVDTRVDRISDPVPFETVRGDTLVNAARIGAEFVFVEDGSDTNAEPGQRAMALTQEQRVLIMRFSEHTEDIQDVTRLRELLALDESSSRFDIVDPAAGDYDPIAPREDLSDIVIDTRSLMGVMYYLSNGVAVPAEDMVSGPVTATTDEDGNPFDWQDMLGDIFAVHFSNKRPDGAAVAVPYRGKWFYIDYDDERTLSTFALLNQLASLQSGGQKGTAPVLTIPVGG